MRILQSKAACVLCAAALAAIPSVTKAATFTPLGFLVTDNTDPNFATRTSVANSISADGTTVVGWSTASSNTSTPSTDSAHEAFVWTSANGLKGIGTIAGAPAPYTSEATGASSDGTQVAGFGDAPDPNNSAFTDTKGFRYATASGSFTDLGSLSTTIIESKALAISGDGNTVVGWSYDDNLNQRAFFYRDSNSPNKMLALPGFGNATQFHGGAAHGVNTDGSVVVGQEIYHTVSGTGNQEGATVGALWTITPAGTTQTPVELQDFSSVIGTQHYETSANGVSADGTAAVGYAVSTVGSLANVTQAVEWAVQLNGASTTASLPTGLGFIDGPNNTATLSSVADATNKDGSVVVGESLTDDHSSTPHDEAFIWFASGPNAGMHDLEDFLTSITPSLATELSGWTLTEATGISSDGLTISGIGSHPDPTNPKQTLTEAFVVTVPEPACLPLLGLSAFALRRRKAHTDTRVTA